jgi:hypothetical protein
MIFGCWAAPVLFLTSQIAAYDLVVLLYVGTIAAGKNVNEEMKNKSGNMHLEG